MGIEKKKLPDLNNRPTIVGTDLLHANSSTLDYKTQSSTFKDYMFGVGSAKLINYQSTMYTISNSQLALTPIPLTNAKPTSSQGINIGMTNNYSVVSTSNRLIVRMLLYLSATTSSVHLTLAAFDQRNPTPSISVAAATKYSPAANIVVPVSLIHIIDPPIPVAGAFITTRAGATVATNITYNGISGTLGIFGGAMQSYIEIYEVLA